MINAIKTVISSGRYELADLLGKIDKLWLQGGLSDADHDALVKQARDHHDPAGGYASFEQQIRDLTARVEALERGNAPVVADEYPAWKQPTHAGDAYYAGSKMTYIDGKRYNCIAPEGYAVVYGPDVLPNFWELIA
jgi:hypothetical protein